MTRRRFVPLDSLDLLLDTICNTFGGIIFIALLVVLMLLVSGKPSGQASLEQSAATAEFQRELENLTNLKARLNSNLREQAETVDELADTDLSKMLQDYQQSLDENVELKQAIATLRRKILTLQNEDTSLADEAQLILPELQSVESEVQELQTALDQMRRSRVTTLKTPVVRSSGSKTQLIVVLQYQRLYIWHRYSSNGERQGLNLNDFLLLSDGGLSAETTPNPLAGVPLDESDESAQAIRRILSRFRPSQFYIAALVRPDSYGAFKYLRDVATEMNFEYDLRPTTADETWYDRGGSGGTVQ